MMSGYFVDLGGLDALGKNLQRAVDNIDDATRKLKDVGPDSIGPDDLDEACSDFRDSWDDGLQKIREGVDGVKGGLDKAMQGYAELDTKIKGSLQRMQGQLGQQAGPANG